MAVPEHIRAVERPSNTVVYAYGKNKDRYAVKMRVGCRYEKGKNPKPINGPTIGYIIDGKFVPKEEKKVLKVAESTIDLKDWANIELCNNLMKELQQELEEVYCHEDALKIYCIALLRVCYPGIKDYELGDAYKRSFLSELYPNVALSRNTVSKFLNDLGKTCSHIIKFMQKRAQSVNSDEHILVDGTLKSNESKVNSLADFSRKAKTKGTRDISVIYAFNLEKMEPICSKCYPGNMLDVTAYADFIQENAISKGIIVADKGFPAKAAQKQFDENPDLHYLNPIKRNSKFIETHQLLHFTNMLIGFSGIAYKKAKCNGINKWLYSFRDTKIAAIEEQEYFTKAQKNGTYDHADFCKKQESFGTIVLECDLDLDAETIYKAYSQRWEIELVMRFYKSACCFDETRVHDDYSVIGSEFCDFLSTVLTFKLIKTFDSKKILEKMTYKKVMSILKRAKKVRINDSAWHLIKINPSHEELLQKLELLPQPKTPLHKRAKKLLKNDI